MRSTRKSLDPLESSVTLDGFDVLDACHRETLLMLSRFADVVAVLDERNPSQDARATAEEAIKFFSTTARQHHEDEERHIFPALLAGGDADVVQAVLRLQQDHRWMDVDWMELAPLIAAVAAGQDGYDLAALREGVAIFTGLTQDHIALEESYIYPAARVRLRAGELRDMGRELARVHRDRRAGRSKDTAVRKDVLGANT